MFQAPLSFKISFQVKTPVINNKESAMKAVKVASIFNVLPKTHNNNAKIKIPIITFSGTVILPIFSNSESAHSLAFGVSFISGG